MPKDPVSSDSPENLALGALAIRCSTETERFYSRNSHDPRYCFEIFRRAGEDENERAWEILYEQYHAQVHGWILRHPAFPSSKTEPQDCLNEAFARLFQALSGENFAKFANLASILQFLKMCVHSVIIDHARKSRLQEVSIGTKFAEVLRAGQEGSPEAQLEIDLERSAFWTYIRSCLKDEQEIIVVYENYALDLKSREKYERHPDLFSSVKDVYRVKQNVLARLRRDAQVSKRFQVDA